MDIKIGTYRHSKGKMYEVIGIARHSETLEEMVVYRALYDSAQYGAQALWVRPKAMFCDTIRIDGVEKPRFEYVG